MFRIRIAVLAPMLAAAAAFAALALGAMPVAAAPGAATAKCTSQQGDAYIAAGRYDRAVREFSCVIDAQPTEGDGYRGRIEAELQLGRFSDALRDYARVTAFVLPVHPDAREIIRAAYVDRLAASPNDVVALTAASFERWSNFDYPQATHLLNQLVDVEPNDVYANVFSGSVRLLHHSSTAQGVAYLET